MDAWPSMPISNLFLRLNKYGQFLLDSNEKMSSNFVGLSLLTCLLGLILFFSLSDEKYLTIAAYGFAMMVPFSVMLSPSKYKYSLLIYAISMAIVGLVGIGIALNTGEIFNGFTTFFLIGFVVFQWVANLLMIRN